MGHWANIRSDNRVRRVVVADDDQQEWLESALGGTWLQTSYNTRGGVHYDPETGEPSADQLKALRFNYAGIGYTFDPDKGTDGAFIPPKPFESWVLDETTCLWVAPVAMPEDGQDYTWNESAGEWVVSE